MTDEELGLRNVPLLNTGEIQLGDTPIKKQYIIQHPFAKTVVTQVRNGIYKELFDEMERAGLNQALVKGLDAKNCICQSPS
jgi:hypothetical protein